MVLASKATDMAEVQPTDDDLMVQVRAAAEQLVSELQTAESLTAGWKDADHSYALVETAARKCLASLAATGCWGEANRLPSSELWRIAARYLEVGSLQIRARNKPRGYAGDYEMLQMICDRYYCDHPLGRVFDRFFQNQDAPQAVRHRTDLIAKEIVAERHKRGTADFHIVSVGAGPAIDVTRALAELSAHQRRTVRVTLLDLDPLALEHARRSLEPMLAIGQLNCVRENLFRLPKLTRAASALSNADFLFCSGFFDYLDDLDAVSMLATFWRHVLPGGRLLVFNFSTSNSTRAYMEWIGNWYLIHRDPRQMHQIAERAALPGDQYTVGAEAMGVNLFLRGDKR